MSKSRITVLLPSHNGATFLAEAIESVLQQTHDDLALVIIDDASTDATAEMAQRYAEQDDRVSLLRLSTQHGLANALNVGLAQCVTTEWFAIQNDDDWWHPDKLVQQWAFVESHPHIAVVGTEANVIDASGQLIEPGPVPISPATIRLALCASDCMFTPSALLNTQAVKQAGGFGSGWNYSEDYLLWTKLLRFAELANIPDALYHYRWHGGNMSVTQGNRQVMDSIRISQRYVAAWFQLPVERDHVLFWYPPQYQRRYLSYKRRHLKRVVQSIRYMSRLIAVLPMQLSMAPDLQDYGRNRQLAWLDNALYGLSWRQRWWVYPRILTVAPPAFWLRQAKRWLGWRLR